MSRLRVKGHWTQTYEIWRDFCSKCLKVLWSFDDTGNIAGCCDCTAGSIFHSCTALRLDNFGKQNAVLSRATSHFAEAASRILLVSVTKHGLRALVDLSRPPSLSARTRKIFAILYTWMSFMHYALRISLLWLEVCALQSAAATLRTLQRTFRRAVTHSISKVSHIYSIRRCYTSCSAPLLL